MVLAKSLLYGGLLDRISARLQDRLRRTNAGRRRAVPRRRPRSRLQGLAAPAVERLEDRTLLSVIAWDGDAGNGDWNTAANWDGDVLPGPGDDAEIGSGFGTIIHGSGATSINSLSSASDLLISGGTFSIAAASSIDGSLALSGGEFAGAGDLVVDTMQWTGGTMSGSGATTVETSLDIDGPDDKLLVGRTLNNAGAAVMDGGGDIDSGQQAVINNLAGATFTVLSNGDILSDLDETVTQFNNEGAFVRGQRIMAVTVRMAFNNAGTVDIQTGTVELEGGGTSTGSFTGAAGTTLRLHGGTHALNSGASVIHPNVEVTHGQTQARVNLAAGAVLEAENLKIDGGILDLTADATAGALNLNRGELIGSGNLTIDGLTTWTGGTMGGSGATHANGGMLLDGGNKEFVGRTLNNAGAATWTAGALNSGEGAVLNNLAGATLDIQFAANAGLFHLRGGATPQFNNAGALTVSAAAADVRVDVRAAFHNSGTVRLNGGLFRVNRYTQTAGETVLGGAGWIPLEGVDLQGGTLSGNGEIDGDISNTGAAISPGSSAGSLTVDGLYTQGAGGTLHIEIGGRTAAQFDQFVVTRTATLAGTLDVDLIDGFVPVIGDSFVILSGNSAGSFDSLDLAPLPDDRVWQVSIDPVSSVSLQVVKVPFVRPQITGPVGAITDETPQIEWDRVPGATEYQVIVYDTSRGQEVINAFVTSTTFTPPAPMRQVVAHQSFVRAARAADGGGREFSLFSRPEYFSIDQQPPLLSPPELTGPIGQTSDRTPTLTWTGIPGAESYQILVYDRAAGRLVPGASAEGIEAELFELPVELATGREYEAYVRVDGPHFGFWGGPRIFRVTLPPAGPARPELTVPVSPINDSTPTITWKEFEGAVDFRLELYDVDRGQRILVEENIDANEFTLADPVNVIDPLSKVPGTYQVFVRANLDGGEVSPWSRPIDFRIENHGPQPTAPFVMAPLTPTFDTTPTFIWTESFHTVEYEVFLRTEAGDLVEQVGNLTTRSFIPSTPLAPGKYSFRVRGHNTFGDAGPLSREREVEVLAARQPGEAEPALDDASEAGGTVLIAASGNESNTWRPADIAGEVEAAERFETGIADPAVIVAVASTIEAASADDSGGASAELAARRDAADKSAAVDAVDDVMIDWPQLEWWSADRAAADTPDVAGGASDRHLAFGGTAVAIAGGLLVERRQPQAREQTGRRRRRTAESRRS